MGCEIAATSISKIFFARFTIIMHFVIKLPMLQNPVLVKYTCNYINQLAYNCTLLFLIPKTLLGTFEKNYTPWFCFLGGGQISIPQYKRGWMVLNIIMFSNQGLPGKQNMLFSAQCSICHNGTESVYDWSPCEQLEKQ